MEDANFSKSKKTYVKKNGEMVEKIYNQSQYNKTWWDKNQETIRQKHNCDLCGGSYYTYNRGIHNKTKKHIKADAESKIENTNIDKLF